MKIIKTIFKFIIGFANILLSIFGIKLFLHRSNKVHKPVIYDQYLWEPYYENLGEIQLYNEAMKASYSTEFDNPYKQLRFYSLQNVFYNVMEENIGGAIVECGVWKGHSAYILSSLLKKSKIKKEFLIFDSFEGGLSDKFVEDKNNRYNLSEQQIMSEKLSFASTEEQVKMTLSVFKNISYYKGWIPERFNEVKDKEFSFVHIDVDLYQPTLDSLNFFYPRLNIGGAIVIDDYGISQFPGARKAVEEFLKANNPSFFYKVPFGSCFMVK